LSSWIFRNFDNLPAGHRKISGVVSKIESGLVTVKTPTRHYTISSKAINAVCRVGDKG